MIAAEAIAGAIWAVLCSCAATDRVAYLPYLADHITFIVLAPYMGAKQAMLAVEEGRNTRKPSEGAPCRSRPRLSLGARYILAAARSGIVEAWQSARVHGRCG